MLKTLLLNLLRAPAHMWRARRDRRVLPELEAAVALFNEKKYAESVDVCMAAITREPRSAQANHLCGRSLIEMGRDAEAEPYIKCATAIDPNLAEAHADFATVRFNAGDYAAAEESCRKAIAGKPMEVRYRLQLVGCLEKMGRERDAYIELSIAQEYAPERADLLMRVCSVLDRLGRYPEMLQIAERATMENGENFETLNCLAVARHGLDDMQGAADACRKALTYRTDVADVYVTLGSALFEQGLVDEALTAHRRALKIDPDFAIAHYDMGIVNLMRGKYREGWEGFDQRFRLKRNQSWRACDPRWNGTSLRGRTILIMREQGLGDEIMYSSCYPEIISGAQRCFIECDPRLERLFTRSFPEASFVPLKDVHTKEQTDPGVPIDVRSYAGSLPRYLRNSLRDFPAHKGFLKADPQRVDYWRQRVFALGQGMKVGISWRGGTALTRRGRRSFSLQDLLPLLSVSGVSWVNLQYGERAGEIEALEKDHGISIADWPDAIDGDYDETAALVSTLDLVISVCTSVIHLAGALGKPVWIMAAYIPEWRYGLKGSSMPWYPSVTMYRQEAAGVWDPVIAGVAENLKKKVLSGGG